jgi:hypothetical protein
MQQWQKDGLALVLKHADAEDFDYIEELLRRSITHAEDIRPRYWLAVLQGTRAVLNR